ncbi:MAG: major capsid protein [Bacilli bacterium]
MNQSLLPEAKDLGVYVQERAFAEMLWPNFFPVRNVMSLSYETLIGSKGAPVAADVVTWDTSAPEKTRKAISKLTGEIPPIRMKKKMSEKDLIDYYAAKNSGYAGIQQILDLVYGDTDACVDGVNARLEWLALKALSQTYVALSKTTNGGGVVTASNIDFQMPTANKKCASVVWSATASTTKPITDFRTVVAAARLAGVKLKYALMDVTDFGYFTASTETQNTVYAMLGTSKITIAPTLEMANNALRSYGLPEILLIEQSITTETEGAHTQTSANPWVTGHVTFVPDMVVGDMLSGPIMEELNPPKQVTQTKVGPILVSKYSEVDPVAEYTKGEANAFPSWPTVNSCYSLYTLNASTWA